VWCRNQSGTVESKKVQLQLEDKNAEFEQLALVLHRTRGDLTRKLEKQQKEYDDKIAFLIQQLRGAEMKIHESSTLLRKSFDGSDSVGGGGLGTSQHRNAASMYLRPRTSHVAGSSVGFGMSAAMDGQTSEGPLLPSSSSGDEAGKREDSGRGREQGGGEARRSEEQVTADALRKWEGEKQRRELLEKRNSELMRELRIYRERERK
jgi:hypothetical protein